MSTSGRTILYNQQLRAAANLSYTHKNKILSLFVYIYDIYFFIECEEIGYDLNILIVKF